MHLGKEIYLFFLKYKPYGIIGIFVSAILMGIIIYKVLKISKKEKIENYEQFINCLNVNKNIKLILQIIIQIFLLISFYVMVAGFSAYFMQEWNMPKYIGTLIIVILSYIIFMGNIERLINANTILVPVIILAIIVLTIKSTNMVTNMQNCTNNTSIIKAIWNAIIYTSYNSIVLIPILIPLSNKIKQNKKHIEISIICAIILIILSLSIYILIQKINININKIELPTVYIAGMMGYKYKILYGIVIMVSIYTSTISAGYSFLEKYKNDKNKYKKIAIGMCLFAFLISNIGFSKLLNLLYPICGILGIFQIILIINYIC